MTQTKRGELVRSVKQLEPGDPIRILVSDGTLNATVTDIVEDV